MAKYDPDEFFSAERQLTKKLTKEKRQLTNADRIRQMSDEELADVLDHVQGDAFLVGVGERKNSVYPGAGISWLEWLQQEAEQ